MNTQIFTDCMNKKITNASFGFAYGICNNFITVWIKEIQPGPGHVPHEPASHGCLGVESVNKFVHKGRDISGLPRPENRVSQSPSSRSCTIYLNISSIIKKYLILLFRV